MSTQDKGRIQLSRFLADDATRLAYSVLADAVYVFDFSQRADNYFGIDRSRNLSLNARVINRAYLCRLVWA